MDAHYSKKENERLQRENELLKIELEARKKEPYWEKACMEVARKYRWTPEQCFPNDRNASSYRKEMSGKSPYIEIRALKMNYNLIKHGRLVDEDTLEEIVDPHDMILHHVTSGTFNPVGFCKWDNVRIKHKKNDRCIGFSIS